MHRNSGGTVNAKIVEPMKTKRTVQVFDVEEWPICEYCGMPIEPNEVDWHKHHERWMLRQRQNTESSKSKTPSQVYLTAQVLEPPKS